MSDATTTRDSADLEVQLERHRIELTAYCYRMLGSSSDAEDAVQDTMVRAWKGYDRFEGRSALRSWLYRIATNVCFDMLNGKQRRARPMDFGPAQTADAPLPAPLPEATWLEPVPDGRVVPEQGDPAELAVARDSIRLAFVATLQHLPARQRAVLILREVLRWPATEVAELLETTVASVNSALQRARATLEASGITDSDAAAPLDEQQRELLARYVDAFERYDLDTLVTLLSEDVRQSMPPYALWLIGPEEIRAWMLGPGAACRGSRLFPTVANGMPAYAQYKPSGPGGASSPGRSTCWRSLTVALSGSTSSSTPRRSSRSSASTKRSKTRSSQSWANVITLPRPVIVSRCRRRSLALRSSIALPSRPAPSWSRASASTTTASGSAKAPTSQTTVGASLASSSRHTRALSPGMSARTMGASTTTRRRAPGAGGSSSCATRDPLSWPEMETVRPSKTHRGASSTARARMRWKDSGAGRHPESRAARLL